MYDFVLYFGKIDAPPLMEGEELNKEEIKARVVARIRLTPKIAEGLLVALQKTLESFKENNEIEGEKWMFL